MPVFRVGLYRWGYDVYIPPGESPTGKAILQRKRVLLKGVPEAEALAHVDKLRREAEASLCNAPREAETPQRPAKGGLLQDALLLAWQCPEQGLARTREGTKTYRRAAECVAALGATLPCVSVDNASYSYLRSCFEDRALTPCAAHHRIAAFHRVLHFAVREGWIARRPVFDRSARFARPQANAERASHRITIRTPDDRTLRDALRLAWEYPQKGWSRKAAHGKAEHRRAAECVRMVGETLPCVRVTGQHMATL